MRNSSQYPKVLLISDATWSDTNNIGNTFNSLFEKYPKDKIAMIYARPDLPNTRICNKFFQISENRLLKNIIKKGIKPGKVVSEEELSNNQIKLNLQEDEKKGQNMYRFFRRYRLNLFLFMREVLWKIGNWKTKELNDFIDDYKPDIIFNLACSNIYMNKLQQYIIKKTNKKAILYFVDDVYLTKRKTFSFLFWIIRPFIRRNIRQTVKLCNLIYTIIPKQKNEYDSYFKVNSKILNKGGDFNTKLNHDDKINKPIKLVYTGNIYSGRWEILAKIGESLDKINKNKEVALLYIYTKNELYPKIKKIFANTKSIRFMGSISANEVVRIQKESDILVHVESFRITDRLKTRLSFSTKLVDYFEQEKCILAVGWKDAASIDYLIKNNAACVITDLEEMQEKLKNLLENPDLVQRYGKKAWECGKKNHEIKNNSNIFYRDLLGLVKEREYEGCSD